MCIFDSAYLNEISVELAEKLGKVLVGKISKLRLLLDQLLCFLLQWGHLLPFRFGSSDEKLLFGTSNFAGRSSESSVLGLQFFDEGPHPQRLSNNAMSSDDQVS